VRQRLAPLQFGLEGITGVQPVFLNHAHAITSLPVYRQGAVDTSSPVPATCAAARLGPYEFDSLDDEHSAF
jgi:hypothetical protein